LPQRSGFRQSFAFAGLSADRGYSIVVFPEGKRTQTGEIAPFQSGIGMLANRLGLPVLPMRIDGLFTFKSEKRHFAPPGAITVRIGEPVRYPGDAEPQNIAADLQRRVVQLGGPTSS
jgi:long-chain acyl-CoA synthetase